MNNQVLIDALELAANRLDRAAFEVEQTRSRHEVEDWATEARETVKAARAALQSPAPEGGEPTVVAWMWRDINGDMQFNYMHPDGEDLMTIAQHRAIVAGLGREVPGGWQARFTESGDIWDAWQTCSKEHYDLVKRFPNDWPGYEVREIYAAPLPPSPAAKADA